MSTDTNTPVQTVQPAKRRSKWKKRLIVLTVLTALFGGSGYAVVKVLSGPSEGTVFSSSPPVAPPAAVELEQFDGTYISFARPMNYKLQPPPKVPEITALETHSFITTGIMRKTVSATVTNFPSGRLDDDASYYMRKINPDKYVLTPQTIKGEKVVVTSSKSENLLVAFWPHGGKLLTFTMTGTTTDANATTDEYQKMLESVSWR